MSSFKEIAIIGSTASGKTSYAIEYAQKFNGNILSLDSLSIYKEIDIVSAKPTRRERNMVKHFGLDVIYPNEPFSVMFFIELYRKAKDISIEEGKNLIIVGGSSFYLKILLDGISPMPKISEKTTIKTDIVLQRGVEEAHRFLLNIDEKYMSRIASTDIYRVEKMLNLYYETGLSPTQYFKENPPKPIIDNDLPIYEIFIDRDILRKRIELRTQKMLDDGLIDEVAYLDKSYGRTPNCMKAIGIKEVLAYFDGIYSYDEMKEKIITNTSRLAKRQKTFNRSNFPNRFKLMN